MKKILINDGISASGLNKLQEAGFECVTDNIPQDQLSTELNNFDAILVRSATKVRQELIDQAPNIKLIGRGGVGMDNIDVDYARSKGINVINTPAASSPSVAELAIAHLFTGVRFLHDSNRQMPSNGNGDFKVLKKKYAKGIELKGKTIGILGFGRIGQETAKLALGLGMNVLAYDLNTFTAGLKLNIADQEINVSITTTDKENVIKNSDFISIHVPFASGDTPAIGAEEFRMMKQDVILVNCGRGGSINENALIEALDNGKVSYAGIDVFENEPAPREDLLIHPNVSLTPHIGGATVEAQDRIGLELADQIIAFFNN